MALLSPLPKQPFFSNAGAPAAGWKLHTYLTNSTTPAPTYKDRAGSVPNTNPIILDARGEAVIYLPAGQVYRYVLTSPTDVTEWTRDGIEADPLATDLASTTPGKGAALVTYTPTLAQAVARGLQVKLDELLTVEDWRYPEDTSDGPAVLRMLAATNGRAVFLDKEYAIGDLSIPTTYATLSFIGAKMPRANATITKLFGGTVLVGRMTVRCNDVTVTALGVDCGAGRSIPSITEGLVIDAKQGERGNRLILRNVASLGANEANPTHAILAEGYDYADISNIYVSNHRYGCVYKGRNAQIRDIDADKIYGPACYVKSDIPDYAGFVLDATVANVQVRGVRHRASSGNTTATAVSVHASTASVANVQVSQASITFGAQAVQVMGPGTIAEPPISSVVVTDTLADGAQGAVSATGYNYDCTFTDTKAINPATGSAVDIAGASEAWKVSGVHVLVSNPAITGANCMNLAGTGQWSGVTVRNPYQQMLVNQGLTAYGAIIAGQYSGNVRIYGEGNLTLVNLVNAGTPTPALKINPGSVVELAGQLTATVATGTAGLKAATLPISITGTRYFSVAAKNSGGTITTVRVRLSGADLSIEDTYTGFQWIDLSGISFRY